MLLKGLLEERTPYRKFLILVGLTLMGAIIGTLLGSMLSSAIFGIDLSENSGAFSNTANPNTANALKLIQLFSALGMFIFPPIMAAVLFSKDAKSYLGLNTKVNATVGSLVIALMIAVVPFINWMMTVNEAMKLPASFSAIESWMKQSEISAAQITELFLKTTSIGGLLTNMFIIAIIPAIGEELLFRGVIQKLFSELANNKHVGIVLGAFLFSAMHMQFYGFLPRFALGVMLGYLYLWSGSLWLPMLAHFLNNGMAILFAWMEARKGLPFNQDTFGVEPGQEIILALSVFLTWVLLFLVRKFGASGFKV